MQPRTIARPVNPLASPANRCFVCGPDNVSGLNIRFRMDGDVCRGAFTPGADHVGYDGVTHGGILFCLLDDVMANVIFLNSPRGPGAERCYTAKAEVRYRQALPVGTTVGLEGWLTRRKGRLAICEGKVLRQDDGSVVAESEGSFMIDAERDPARRPTQA